MSDAPTLARDAKTATLEVHRAYGKRLKITVKPPARFTASLRYTWTAHPGGAA